MARKSRLDRTSEKFSKLMPIFELVREIVLIVITIGGTLVVLLGDRLSLGSGLEA